MGYWDLRACAGEQTLVCGGNLLILCYEAGFFWGWRVKLEGRGGHVREGGGLVVNWRREGGSLRSSLGGWDLGAWTTAFDCLLIRRVLDIYISASIYLEVLGSNIVYVYQVLSKSFIPCILSTPRQRPALGNYGAPSDTQVIFITFINTYTTLKIGS